MRKVNLKRIRRRRMVRIVLFVGWAVLLLLIGWSIGAIIKEVI